MRRSKLALLALQKREIGPLRLNDLNRDTPIAFGERRAPQGAGPLGLGCGRVSD
jgi:hypothetical protein